MEKLTMMITNFASGELSPTLNGRVDLQQYYSGASHLENFSIIPTGGIKRRVGFKRVQAIEHDSRIIPFILNKNRSFIFELYYDNTSEHGVLQIWEVQIDGSLLAHQNAIQLPYISLAEIKEIQYAQNYDTLVMTHRSYRPYIIVWNANGGTTNTFTCSQMEFDFYPDVLVDDDFGYIMILGASATTPPVVTATQTGGYSCVFTNVSGVSETKVYKAGEIPHCIFDGKLKKYDSTSGWLDFENDEIDNTQFITTSKFPACCSFFNNRLFFASTMEKPQKIWASAAPDSKNTRYNDFCNFKKYVTVGRNVKDADLHTFTCAIDVPAAGATQTVLRGVSQNLTQALIKSPTEYYCSGELIPLGTKVVSITADTITLNTRVDITSQQLNVVCTIQLWKTADEVTADDYEFKVLSNNTTSADDAFNFEIASDENDYILFLSSNKFLTVGTESSVWSIPAGVNALQIAAEMQGRYGSDNIQGMAVATATIYFAQGKKGIREFYYNSQVEAFQTNNIAIAAEQMLTESPVEDFDYVTNPYNRIICVRADGQIVTLLYDKNNGVMGWSRVTMENCKFRNVAVVRGAEQNDLIYSVVKDGDGINTKYFIELYDDNNQVYLDSWQLYQVEQEIENAYQSTAILFNITKDTTCSVTSIPEDFIDDGDIVYIGYKFTSDIISMPIINNDPTGKKRIVDLIIRFYNSYMPKVRFTNKPDELITGVIPPFSGIKKVTFPGASDRDVDFELQTDELHPVCILSINADLT